MRRWLSRLFGTDAVTRMEREIRDELELHLELRTDENIASGMAPAAARRDAEQRFGDFERIVERGRQVRLDPSNPLGRFPSRTTPHATRARFMNDFMQDLQYGARTLAKSPGFTLVAVLSLALGIGFNSTVFTVIDAVVFKPRAVEDPDSLVRIGAGDDTLGGIMQSYPDFRDLREQAESFTDVAAWRTEMTTYNHRGDAEFVFGESVSAELFDLLGVQPILGRGFAPDEDDHPGGDRVVMVSERFWGSRLGSDPEVIGRELVFAGVPFTLIGVIPSSYTGGTPPIAVNFWLPISNLDTLQPSTGGTSRLERRGSHSISVIARLKPGVSREAAQEEVRAISSALTEAYPETNDDTVFTLIPASDVRIDPSIDRAMLPAGGVLMAVVGLVLLISCANLANMMLARGSARNQEVAVRQAMGASRWRLVRQMMTESLLLAALGGLAAVGVAAASLRVLQAIKPPVMIPIDFSVPIDPRVLSFTALLAVVAGVAFGLVPALRSTQMELTGALKANDARSGTRGNGLRSTLVAVQVAVSLVLLISAALLGRSLINAQTIDPGITTDSIVSIVPGIAFQGYSAQESRDFHRQAVERIAALPGVERAAFVERMPLESMTIMDRDVWFQDQPLEAGEEAPGIMSATVTPDYFDVLGIRPERGRLIEPGDVAEAPGVAVVNQAFVDRFWPEQNPIGKRISLLSDEGPWIEVVGVNSAHKILTLGEEPTAHMYLPFEQRPASGLGSIVARVPGDAAAALDGMRQVVRELDPNLAIMETKTIQQHLAISLFPVRLAAAALGILGAVGAVLAALGVYGVVAFGVARRTHEIGIRMAVGADRNGVVRLVLRQGMRVVLIGAAVGVAVSLVSTRVLGAILYGVSATDAAAFGGAILAIAGVALVANLVPALRASRVDPIAALRSE